MISRPRQRNFSRIGVHTVPLGWTVGNLWYPDSSIAILTPRNSRISEWATISPSWIGWRATHSHWRGNMPTRSLQNKRTVRWWYEQLFFFRQEIICIIILPYKYIILVIIKDIILLSVCMMVLRLLQKQTLKNGTTTACYFATLHGETSTILAERAAQRRQRAFIGKVNMNIPRDDGYWESTEESVENTTAFIESVEKIGVDANRLSNWINRTWCYHTHTRKGRILYYSKLFWQSPLVKAIITPRFALSCNMELMQELAKIAKAKDLHIQVPRNELYVTNTLH